MAIKNLGLMRELQAILTLYLATILAGFNHGFSATTIPAIKEEMMLGENKTTSLFLTIQASEEGLSWFGMI